MTNQHNLTFSMIKNKAR